jgi:hypothetical protein
MANEQELQTAAARIAEARMALTRIEAISLLGVDDDGLARLVNTGRLKGKIINGAWTTTLGNVLACAATLPE